MTYLTNESDNITLHFFNPAWTKSTEYTEPTSKVSKRHVKCRESIKHATNRKALNGKLVQQLTKPTTASTLHSMNGAWVPTAEQLGLNSEIYRRRKIVIDDAVNYKKPKFNELRNEKNQDQIVQRLCRPTISSSLHKTEKREKLKTNPVIEAIKDINNKRRKITIVNVGLPSIKQTESKILRSFNPWIDESPFEIMKISDRDDSSNRGASKSIKTCDTIIDTKSKKSSKEIIRRSKLGANKIKGNKKKNGKSTPTKISKPKSKEEISHVTNDSLVDSKLLNKPLNLNLDVTEQTPKKVIAPIKVKLINMDKAMRSKYKGKIIKYEEILNSMLAESLEKFEFSFEKNKKI